VPEVVVDGDCAKKTALNATKNAKGKMWRLGILRSYRDVKAFADAVWQSNIGIP
jgi:hypothetical protein